MDTSTETAVTRADVHHAQAIACVRWCSSMLAAKNSGVEAATDFASRFAGTFGASSITRHKAAVGAMTMSGISTPPDLAAGFVRLVHPFTILGRLAGVARAPFNLPLSIADEAPTFDWVGEGLTMRPTPMSFSGGDALAPTKIAGFSVFTKDLLKLYTPAAEQFILNELRRGHIAAMDRKLVDPTIDAIEGVRPASLTNGSSSGPSAGSSAADAVSDFRVLHAAYRSAGGNAETLVYLVSSQNAVALAMLDPERFVLTPAGGAIGGVPTIASDAVGDQIIAIDAAMVVVADDGQADLEVVTEGAVELSDPGSPEQSGLTGVGGSLVSLWQSGLVAVGVTRFVNWRREGVCVRINGAAYYLAGSPA